MVDLIVLSALVLFGFGALGLALGVWSILCTGERIILRQATLDGFALGAIVVAGYWAIVISYAMV